MQKNYWVISMVTDEANFAPKAVDGGFIALSWREVVVDLTPYSGLEKKKFTEKLYGSFEKAYPEKTEASIMSSVSQLYRFLTAIETDDIVFLRDTENGVFHIGRVSGGYKYSKSGTSGTPFKHSRSVEWIATIERTKFTQEFLNAAGGALTFFSLSDRAEEIEKVLSELKGDDIEKTVVSEALLEEYIVKNWSKLSEFEGYDIYSENDAVVGKQYIIPQIGRIDILAKSKDGKKWLVVELKKGKTNSDVVGQILRYIGWIKKNEAESDEEVLGLIIAGQEDDKLMYALETLPNVGLLTYKVNFKLNKIK